jgi:phage terminase large subunit-like protein
MIRLKRRGLPVKPFPQTAPMMIQASQLMYDLFKGKNFETYADELARKHVQMSVAQNSSRGFRIVKNKTSKRHKIDYLIALTMASFDVVKNGGADVSIPLVMESPYSDASVFISPEDARIPFELRE